MKLPAICTLLVLSVAGASQAGSFGGPPPFTNLSPLQTGIDGSYQATARGDNLTGVIRFAYSQGVQTPVASANTYVFFVGGQVVSGSTTASITGKDLAGILGGQDFSVPTNENGSTELPLVFIVRGNRANGEFEGRLDLEDRLSAFSGTGAITGAPDEQNTIIFIPDNQDSIFADNQFVSVTNFTVPGSDLTPDPNLVEIPFSFEGVRNSVVAQGSFSSPTGQ